MMGLMGMAQVVATIAYGIRGLRRGDTTWDWPDFNANPEQENLAQISRWSLNSTPAWEFPPLAIANQYRDQSGEASAVSSDIGTRVRSCVAEPEIASKSQGRASR